MRGVLSKLLSILFSLKPLNYCFRLTSIRHFRERGSRSPVAGAATVASSWSSLSRSTTMTAVSAGSGFAGTAADPPPPAASSWMASDAKQAAEARDALCVWPLDEHNARLLNEVHPRNPPSNDDGPHDLYDLVVIGSGAGGLVSSRQSARRGAKSCLISERLAGGDCLNVGCVPSKALLRVSRAVAEAKRAAQFGIVVPGGDGGGSVQIDFARIMTRLRQLRSTIAPVDGHRTTVDAGAHVFQGRGRFTGRNTVEVNDVELRFKKAVIATGGRPVVPDVPGLAEAPYTTNEILFNLEVLPPRMFVLGAGFVALEMAQCFATFGSNVTVLLRPGKRLFESKQGDPEAAQLLQAELEKSGVHFVSGTAERVDTLRERPDDPKQFPLLKMTVATDGDPGHREFDCECLLVATGRAANVEDMGLDQGEVEYRVGKGVIVNDLAQSVSNPNVYAVGDCVAGVPRLTHMSGEMAKLVVQNGLFGDNWKLSDLVVPSCMYTEPEYATVGLSSEAMARGKGVEVDTWRTGLEHNDRAILDGSNAGFAKILCKKGTDEIVGATVVAERAGDIINEVSLAMKNGISLRAIGRNIHCYPTTGECVMMCGVQFINSRLPRLD